jgi:uncharacterized protein (TIGR03435 family)
MSRTLLSILADVSIRASLAAMLVAGVLAAIRVRISAVRHASWTAVLLAMLLMPALTRSVPALAVPWSLAVPALPASSDVDRREAAPERLSTAPSEAASARVDPRPAADAAVAAPASAPVDRPPQRSLWPVAGLAVYGLGAAAMLMRFLIGWRGAARIARVGEPIELPRESLVSPTDREGIDVRESRAVAVPVTVGLIRQAILLPVEWRHWSIEKLRAVLAHEVAHVRRRDLPVAFTAHLNRCLFWFHPLSWWLERTLAATAEQAADEDAISVVGDRAAYAEILLDMARAVGQGRGRIAWLGVGIDGSGLLHQRIERVLSGEPRRQISTARKAIVALGCVSAILIAVACRPSAATFGEDTALERRDHALHLQLTQVERRQWRHFADVDWDAGAAGLESLEAAVNEHPDDLGALQRFLMGYWVQYAPSPTSIERNPLVANKVVDPRLLVARRTFILRLIERHPDADLADAVEAQIFPKDLTSFFPGDPPGYQRARAAWIGQTRRSDASAVVLGHAADFFAIAEKPLAEQMLLRARALDPQGPWTARLGQFYKIVFRGAMAPSGRNNGRMVSAPEPRSAYAMAIREKLGASSDEMLLTATGWFLGGRRDQPFMDLDTETWGEACLTRALEINPRAVLAHTALLDVRRQRNNHEPLWRVAPASRDAYVAALSERERFEQLPNLARDAYGMVADFDRLHDPNLRGRLELGRDQARRYAEDALKLAPKFLDDPNYGTTIYTANMTLSALALHDRERKASVAYLERASQAPPSEELVYGGDVVWRRHLRDLLAQGERQAAIAFLERMARTNVASRIELREWAAQLRRDVPPSGPSFDAAKVTLNTSGDRVFARDPNARISRQSGGICSSWGWIQASDTCFTADRMTLRELVAFAFGPYGVGTPLPEIAGGPAWIDDDRFDVVARATGTDPSDPLGAPKLAMMLRTLLEERFTLTLHHESRPLPVYELVLARSDRQMGPRIRPAKAACVTVVEALRASLATPTPAHLPSRPGPCISIGDGRSFKGGAVDMNQLALVLSNRLNRFVRDRTGLAGMFELDLTWEGSAIFTALHEQLGLKLEAASGAVDVLVIDRATAPRVN